MTDKPRLIEYAFPLKQASLDSVHEKNVRHGHISTLHIWPARRPLAACRAAAVKLAGVYGIHRTAKTLRGQRKRGGHQDHAGHVVFDGHAKELLLPGNLVVGAADQYLVVNARGRSFDALDQRIDRVFAQERDNQREYIHLDLLPLLLRRIDERALAANSPDHPVVLKLSQRASNRAHGHRCLRISMYFGRESFGPISLCSEIGLIQRTLLGLTDFV